MHGKFEQIERTSIIDNTDFRLTRPGQSLADGRREAKRRRVVLLGGGHAHIEVVRRLGKRLPPNTEVVLVSPAPRSPYSGMLPGYVAGTYSFDEIHIDLAGLCARSGIAFMQAAAASLNLGERMVGLSNGVVLGYDLLSLDIGSTPSLPPGVGEALSVKPISTFAERLAGLDQSVGTRKGPMKLAVIGLGPAGVEIAFALKQRLDRRLPEHVSLGGGTRIALVGRSSQVIPERSGCARRLIERELARADIDIVTNFDARAVENGYVISADGRRVAADEAIWTTSSAAADWLTDSDLELDKDGFVKVDHYLRSVSHPEVFAAGDIASLPSRRPKTGVFAVRAGPILAKNIGGVLSQTRLHEFRPQRHWLVLLSTTPGRAVADKWGLAAVGGWVANWKRWIDLKFVRVYSARDGGP